MIARVLLAAVIAAAASRAAGAAPPPLPGFTLTLDGDRFSNAHYVLKPLVRAGYCNTWWKSDRDPRTARLALCSDASKGGPELKFDAPPRLGPYVVDRTDEDRPDRNPYMGFELALEVGEPSPRRWNPDHVEIVITKLEEVGGRIEGTVTGTLVGPESVTVRIECTFSVVREKDRIVR